MKSLRVDSSHAVTFYRLILNNTISPCKDLESCPMHYPIIHSQVPHMLCLGTGYNHTGLTSIPTPPPPPPHYHILLRQHCLSFWYIHNVVMLCTCVCMYTIDIERVVLLLYVYDVYIITPCYILGSVCVLRVAVVDAGCRYLSPVHST